MTNRVDPDQMPHSVASYLGLLCLLRPVYPNSVIFTLNIEMPASVTQLDALSDWRPRGRGFNPHRGRQHSFVEIDHEIS